MFSLAHGHFFNVMHSPHNNTATTREIGFPNTIRAHNHAARGEIGTGNQLQQFFIGQFWIVDQGNQSIHNFI